MAEQAALNRQVAGSMPAGSTLVLEALMVERCLAKAEDAGSIPAEHFPKGST